MKKGCFLSAVFFGTIVIGVIFYVVDEYGDEINNFFEEKIVDFTSDSVKEYVLKITDESKKDELEKIWTNVYQRSKNMEFEEGMNYLSDIIQRINRYTKDSVLTDDELSSLKEFVENETR